MLANMDGTWLPWWQVILVFALTAAGTVALVMPRIGDSALKRLLLLSSAMLVGICVLLGLIDLKLLSLVTEENNIIEWLTAGCLAAAACLAFWAAIRVHRADRPSPVAMTLAAGFAWAFSRELEYGGGLVGKQFYFTRNIFHLRSFTGPHYFERFRRSMHLPYDAVTLYVVHICFTAMAAVIFWLLVRYFIRHRARGRAELKNFLPTFYCRLFLLGAGLYIAAEIIGGALHRLPSWGLFKAFTKFHGDLHHRIVEETMECWGAIALLFCAVALWQATRRLAGKTP